jgi:hypothetical protein
LTAYEESGARGGIGSFDGIPPLVCWIPNFEAGREGKNEGKEPEVGMCWICQGFGSNVCTTERRTGGSKTLEKENHENKMAATRQSVLYGIGGKQSNPRSNIKQVKHNLVLGEHLRSATTFPSPSHSYRNSLNIVAVSSSSEDPNLLHGPTNLVRASVFRPKLTAILPNDSSNKSPAAAQNLSAAGLRSSGHEFNVRIVQNSFSPGIQLYPDSEPCGVRYGSFSEDDWAKN